MTQRLLPALSWQLAGETASKALRFLIVAMAARALGQAGFGELSLAMVLGELLILALDLRMDLVVVRRISAAPDEAGLWAGNTLMTRGLVCGAAWLLYEALVPRVARSYAALPNLHVAGLVVLLSAWITTARLLLQSRLMLARSAAGRVINTLVWLAITAGLAAAGSTHSLPYVAAYAAGYAAEALWLVFQAGRTFSWRWRWDASIQKTLLGESLVMGLLNAVILLYYRSDSLVLQALRGSAPVGLYNAAYRVLDLSLFLPSALLAGLYPVVVGWARRTDGQGQARLQELFTLLTNLGLGLSLLLWVLAPDIVALLYGPGYAQASGLLRWLSPSVALLYASFGIGQMLVARRLELALLGLSAAVLVLNLSSTALLVFWRGPAGAAMATGITQSAVLAGYVALLGRRCGMTLTLRKAWRGPAACLPALVLFALLPPLPPLRAGLTAAAAGAGLFWLGGVRKTLQSIHRWEEAP